MGIRSARWLDSKHGESPGHTRGRLRLEWLEESELGRIRAVSGKGRVDAHEARAGHLGNEKEGDGNGVAVAAAAAAEVAAVVGTGADNRRAHDRMLGHDHHHHAVAARAGTADIAGTVAASAAAAPAADDTADRTKVGGILGAILVSPIRSYNTRQSGVGSDWLQMFSGEVRSLDSNSP